MKYFYLFLIFIVNNTVFAEELDLRERLVPLGLSSPAFNHEQTIPTKFTCDGKSFSPPLTIHNVPKNAKSLMLTVVDKESSMPPDQNVIWFIYNIPPQTKTIQENTLPPQSLLGQNSDGTHSYQGLCPKDIGLHHYYFNLYALDIVLPDTVMLLREASELMQDHLVDYASLMGSYIRK